MAGRKKTGEVALEGNREDDDLGHRARLRYFAENIPVDRHDAIAAPRITVSRLWMDKTSRVYNAKVTGMDSAREIEKYVHGYHSAQEIVVELCHDLGNTCFAFETFRAYFFNCGRGRETYKGFSQRMRRWVVVKTTGPTYHESSNLPEHYKCKRAAEVVTHHPGRPRPNRTVLSFACNLATCFAHVSDAIAAPEQISVQIQECCVGDCRYYFRALFELPCTAEHQVIFKTSLFALVDWACDLWTDYDASKVVIQDFGPRQIGFFGAHMPAAGLTLLPLQKKNLVLIDVESACVGAATWPEKKHWDRLNKLFTELVTDTIMPGSSAWASPWRKALQDLQATIDLDMTGWTIADKCHPFKGIPWLARQLLAPIWKNSVVPRLSFTIHSPHSSDVILQWPIANPGDILPETDNPRVAHTMRQTINAKAVSAFVAVWNAQASISPVCQCRSCVINKPAQLKNPATSSVPMPSEAEINRFMVEHDAIDADGVDRPKPGDQWAPGAAMPASSFPLPAANSNSSKPRQTPWPTVSASAPFTPWLTGGGSRAGAASSGSSLPAAPFFAGRSGSSTDPAPHVHVQPTAKAAAPTPPQLAPSSAASSTQLPEEPPPPASSLQQPLLVPHSQPKDSCLNPLDSHSRSLSHSVLQPDHKVTALDPALPLLLP